MKNSADLGGCYPPQPSAVVYNTLLDLQKSSNPAKAKFNICSKFSFGLGSTCASDSGFVLQYEPILTVSKTAKTNKRIRIFYTRVKLRC